MCAYTLIDFCWGCFSFFFFVCFIAFHSIVCELIGGHICACVRVIWFEIDKKKAGVRYCFTEITMRNFWAWRKKSVNHFGTDQTGLDISSFMGSFSRGSIERFVCVRLCKSVRIHFMCVEMNLHVYKKIDDESFAMLSLTFILPRGLSRLVMWNIFICLVAKTFRTNSVGMKYAANRDKMKRHTRI